MRLTRYGLTVFALLAIASPASALTLSGTYYEDQLHVVCTSQSYCMVAFPLPSAIAGKFLNVHVIACSGGVPGQMRQGEVAITDSAAGLGMRRLQPLALAGRPVVGGVMDWRQDIELKVSGGPPRHILVTLTSPTVGNWSILCAMTGEVTTQ